MVKEITINNISILAKKTKRRYQMLKKFQNNEFNSVKYIID